MAKGLSYSERGATGPDMGTFLIRGLDLIASSIGLVILAPVFRGLAAFPARDGLALQADLPARAELPASGFGQ